MRDTFGDYCNRLIGEYNGNISKLTKESTERIFELVRKNNLELTRFRPPTKVEDVINKIKGRFFLIKYDYNGNKLWCPIFVIDARYRSELQKLIIYSVNLSYLPYRFKISFFDRLFKSFKTIIEKNEHNFEQNQNVLKELPLKINFEMIYRILRNNGGFNYSITGFDYSKIVGMKKGSPEMYGVSTNIISRFIFVDVRLINKKEMKDLLKDTIIESEKLKLEEILDFYDKTLFDYENDVKEYYEQLRLMENKYKLFENQE